MAIISCSIGGNLGEHFWLRFSETARYLGMDNIVNTHPIAGKKSEISVFIRIVENYNL